MTDEPSAGIVCDGTWQLVPAPNPHKDSRLNGVAADSASDAWAVGFAGSSPLVLHWNGSTWSRTPVPQVGAFDDLTAVTVQSSHNAWAVGWFQRGARRPPRTLTYHWDGTAWTQRRSPNIGTRQDQLFGVTSGQAGTWAVGGGLADTGEQTQVLHLVGRTWQVVASPNQGTGNNALTGVATVSSSEVLASGVAFGVGGYVARWDGSSWSILSAPVSGSFDAIAAGPHGRAVAAGISPFGRAAFAAFRSRSGRWRGQRIPLSKGEVGGFSGATWSSPDQAWVAGRVAPRSYRRASTLIASWDGSTLTVVASPNPSTRINGLSAAASAGNDTWAVGMFGSRRSARPLIEAYCPPPGAGTNG